MKTNPQTDSPSTDINSTGDPLAEDSSASLTIPKAIGLCAGGLIVSFFLPWVGFMGQGISGFDLQKTGENQRLLWLIPVFSVFTILAAMTRRYHKIIAPISGALPFCVMAYWLNQLGSELLRNLGFGAWLSLGCALALIILPFCRK